MIVEALHPAPASYVPPRARIERFALVACRSPVEIVEDSLARSVELQPLFPDKEGANREELRLLDGRLWSPVGAREGTGPFREATREEFAEWLSGRGAEPFGTHFERQFAGTPLVALGPDPRPNSLVMSRGPQSRGDDIDVSASRKVTLDGRERSRANVARYMAEEVRLLDGRPYMRVAPLLHVEGVMDRLTYTIESRIWPRSPGMRTLPATHETLAACLGIQIRLGKTPPNEANEAIRRRWSDLVPVGSLPDDDVAYVLNNFSGPVARGFDQAIEGMGERTAAPFRAAREALRPVEIAALTGTAHYDPERSVTALRQALELWLARPRASHGQNHLKAFLDEVVVPRMDARAAADLEGIDLPTP